MKTSDISVTCVIGCLTWISSFMILKNSVAPGVLRMPLKSRLGSYCRWTWGGGVKK